MLGHLAIIGVTVFINPGLSLLGADGEEVTRDPYDCGYQSPTEALAAIRAAVEAGQIADPTTKPLPRVQPRREGKIAAAGVATFTVDDIFSSKTLRVC